MPLTYRALLVPTTVRRRPGLRHRGAVFTVTPAAGGSPVAVYDAASGGATLAPGAIKTDANGNISGMYVAEPGAYALTFADEGVAATAAIMDPRDVATGDDVADAVAGVLAHSLALRFIAPGASPLVPNWDVGGDPNGSGDWVMSAETLPIEMPIIERITGTAILYDDTSPGEITYTQSGVYLHSFTIDFSLHQSVGAPDPFLTPGPAACRFYDNQYMAFTMDQATRLRSGQTAWMTTQAAADTNIVPHVGYFQAKQEHAIVGAAYTIVKIAA